MAWEVMVLVIYNSHLTNLENNALFSLDDEGTFGSGKRFQKS